MAFFLNHSNFQKFYKKKESSNILSCFQHGFRRNRSTNTAHYQMIDLILSAFDNKKGVQMGCVPAFNLSSNSKFGVDMNTKVLSFFCWLEEYEVTTHFILTLLTLVVTIADHTCVVESAISGKSTGKESQLDPCWLAAKADVAGKNPHKTSQSPAAAAVAAAVAAATSQVHMPPSPVLAQSLMMPPTAANLAVQQQQQAVLQQQQAAVAAAAAAATATTRNQMNSVLSDMIVKALEKVREREQEGGGPFDLSELDDGMGLGGFFSSGIA
ncbi:hypothetical protein J437_LFUL019250, partial [Ladona fulva]